MMHRCVFIPRLESVGGKIAYVVRARWGSRELDVVRMFEDGKVQVRNLSFVAMGGYYVSFPGEFDKYRGVTRRENWATPIIEIRSLLNLSSGFPTEDEKRMVCEKYPDFKYVLAKARLSCSEIVEFIRIWKTHKDVELLLACGFRRIAKNGSFYKLSAAKKKAVVLFLRNHPEAGDIKLSGILEMMKYGKSLEDYNDLDAFRRKTNFPSASFETMDYFGNHFSASNLYSASLEYREHIRLVGRCGHDTKDSYWKFPANFRKAHDKILKEYKNVLAAELADLKEREELERKKQAAERRKRLELQKSGYAKVIAKYSGKSFSIGKLSVFVPQTIGEIVSQAKDLHQCLITCDYPKQVISGEKILVFVFKNGKPSATAEVFNTGKIGQFYGNERKKNIYPTEAERDAVSEWVKKFFEPARKRNRLKEVA